MWLWALELCSWGYNQPLVSVLGHLTHLYSASSYLMCFGQNISLGEYPRLCLSWYHSGSVGHMDLVFSSVLAWQCWINANAAPRVSGVSLSFRPPPAASVWIQQAMSLRVTSGSSCRTQVLFGRNVTYHLSSSSWKTIQFSSLPNALTSLDCFSHSSCGPQWCLCTRAPGLPYIEILVSWSKAEHESSQIYLFSLTVTLPSGQALGICHGSSYQLSSKAKVLQLEL